MRNLRPQVRIFRGAAVVCVLWVAVGCGTAPKSVALRTPDNRVLSGNQATPSNTPGSAPSNNHTPAGNNTSAGNNTTQVNQVSTQPQSKPDTLPGVSLSWPYFGNNLWQDRFSPDGEIRADTAKQLQTVFDTTLPHSSGGNESFPIESNGVLYVTTKTADVVALNATTGHIIWTYRPHLSVTTLPHMNRGIALWNQRVYVLTSDDQLIALDATTGHQVFDVQVADPATGVFESMAPLVANGLVVVGSSGGDEGVRGFIEAFDAKTGKKRWQFDTVPTRGTGWLPKQGNHGGGAVWTTPTYDEFSHTLYFGTGNPSPDYFGKSRPGPNPYTDSVVKLDVNQGTLVYAKQEVGHDLWDYDVASPPILFSLDGQTVVGEAGKDGEWYEWYADTGKPVIQPVPFVKISHTPPTPSGVLEWPGPDGGANYGPSAYDPMTGQVFVAGINGPETLYAENKPHSGHSVDLGTSQNPGPKSRWSGTITAIDTKTGKADWQVKTPTPPIGGVTVSEGGIVWYGQANGMLTGRSIADGHIVWQKQLNAPIGSAPILYHDGTQVYLCVVTGGATSLASLYPYHGPAHLIGFSLQQTH